LDVTIYYPNCGGWFDLSILSEINTSYYFYVGVGIAWAILSMPYAILSGSFRPQKWDLHGYFQLFVVIPQIILPQIGRFISKTIFSRLTSLISMIFAGVLNVCDEQKLDLMNKAFIFDLDGVIVDTAKYH
jgi:hypothetical protein